jgi:hypothetical protein
MALYILYMLLLFFTIIADTNQIDDDCFYAPGYAGLFKHNMNQKKNNHCLHINRKKML